MGSSIINLCCWTSYKGWQASSYPLLWHHAPLSENQWSQWRRNSSLMTGLSLGFVFNHFVRLLVFCSVFACVRACMRVCLRADGCVPLSVSLCIPVCVSRWQEFLTHACVCVYMCVRVYVCVVCACGVFGTFCVLGIPNKMKCVNPWGWGWPGHTLVSFNCPSLDSVTFYATSRRWQYPVSNQHVPLLQLSFAVMFVNTTQGSLRNNIEKRSEPIGIRDKLCAMILPKQIDLFLCFSSGYCFFSQWIHALCSATKACHWTQSLNYGVLRWTFA